MRGATTTMALVAFFVSSLAWAGDLKIGKDPLETDDSGKLTKAGKAAAVSSIEAEPGNEAWVLHLWAEIDKPAEGPLYVEFYRKRDGKELVAHRHEITDYAGDKYVSLDLEIDRSEGFAPGETVDLAFVQNVGGKDVKKAKATLTLAESSAPAPTPPAEDEEEADDEGEDAAQDGDDDGSAAEPAAPAGPPPVAPSDKKGCRVAGDAPAPWWALVVLAGALPRRRRGRLTCS